MAIRVIHNNKRGGNPRGTITYHCRMVRPSARLTIRRFIGCSTVSAFSLLGGLRMQITLRTRSQCPMSKRSGYCRGCDRRYWSGAFTCAPKCAAACHGQRGS